MKAKITVKLNCAKLILPTKKDLKKAKIVFYKNESRDLFYRVALELVDRAFVGKSNLNLAEAVAVLLQTWNANYYRYFGGFNNTHLKAIEKLISKNRKQLITYKKKNILHYSDSIDKEVILEIFYNFEMILGPVGAAKSLHLLAPQFFPLWDRFIATQYGCNLQPRGRNSIKYLNFFIVSKVQCQHLAKLGFIDKPLKLIDEYNYCKFTKKWI